MQELLAYFGHSSYDPVLWIFILLLAAGILRALDHLAARRWRWRLIHWFAATLVLGLLLAGWVALN